MNNVEITHEGLMDMIAYTQNWTKEETYQKYPDKDKLWRELFHINQYETVNRRLAYVFYTDGKSVSIRLSKPKKEEMSQSEYLNFLQLQEFERMYGIDPGVNSLITASSSNKNNEGFRESYEFTTREYRHKSKFNYNLKKRQRWYKKWDMYEEFKAIPSFKSSSTILMKQYHDYVLPRMENFYQFHLDKNFRGLNFNAYCQNKRTLEHISKSLTKQKRNEKNKKIILGFGDFSQKDGLGKKRPKAPILKIKHHLRQRCLVVDVDEYKTSKTCSCCHKEIEQYKNHTIRKLKRNGKTVLSKRKRGVYTVIRCKNNECKLSCMNRDVNASINMLFLLENLLNGSALARIRPSKFSRPKKKRRTRSLCDTK